MCAACWPDGEDEYPPRIAEPATFRRSTIPPRTITKRVIEDEIQRWSGVLERLEPNDH